MSDPQALLAEIRACRVCAHTLDHTPRPVVRLDSRARILIIGQAPGTRVHETGVPWNDPSGDRLRDWLAVDRDTFYDARRIAIAPMGFCYPGRDARGADRPPRPECAPLWHPRVLAALPALELVLLVGGYAQRRYLGRGRRLADTVRHGPLTLDHPDFAAHNSAPGGLTAWPLPHPSWRNTGWLKRHPWFAADILPALRARLATLLGADTPETSMDGS